MNILEKISFRVRYGIAISVLLLIQYACFGAAIWLDMGLWSTLAACALGYLAFDAMLGVLRLAVARGASFA